MIYGGNKMELHERRIDKLYNILTVHVRNAMLYQDMIRSIIWNVYTVNDQLL